MEETAGSKKDAEPAKPGGARTFPWNWLLVYLLAAAVLVTGGLFFLRYLQDNVKRQAEGELIAITELKASEIRGWLDERLKDARTAVESPFFSEQARLFISGQADAERRERLLRWMVSRVENYGYKSVFLLDGDGEAVLDVSRDGEPLGEYASDLALEAMAGGDVLVSDLHRGDGNGCIHIDLVAPLTPPEGSGVSAQQGALLLRIDPEEFLFPLIQSWPTPSETAESLLVRREGDEVVFLNELRHVNGSALELRIPLGDPELPAGMAVSGVEGLVEGEDYRGVKVLANIRPVPGTDWFLIAKVDASEVYTPVTLRAWLVISLTAALVLAVGLVFALAWSRRQGQFYRVRYKLESERAALSRHYDYLTRYANDIIVLMDRDLRIVEVNERAVQAYGYTREEMIGMLASELRSPGTREQFAETVRTLDLSNGNIHETEHMHKDGTIFPVEVSARVIDVDGNRFYQGIVRDISERKRLEAELRESGRRYRQLFLNSPIGIFQYDSGLVLTECNERFVEILRSSREKLIGLDMNRLKDDSVLPSIRAALAGVEGRYEGLYSATTSEARVYVNMRTTPLRDREGNITGGMGIVEDITERKLVQEELEERELSLRRITDNMLDLISQVDLQGNFVYLSPSNEKVLGYREGELLGTNVMELVHPDDLERVAGEYASANRRLVPGKVEFRARSAGGAYIWVETMGNPLLDERGDPIGAIFVTRDISDRKRTEWRLERLNHTFLELGANPLGNIVEILDTGREILGAEHMHYSRMEHGEFSLFTTQRPQRGFGRVEDAEGLVCYDAIATGREEPLVVEDIASFGYGGFLPEVKDEGLHSYLGYPVRLSGRTTGFLGALYREGGKFSSEVTEIMGMLARAVAGEEGRLAHEEELRDFIDIASHELRHPMTIIKGYTSTIRHYLDRMDDETRNKVLDDMDRGMARLERLVCQLLETARIERRKLALERTETDVAALLEKTALEMRERVPGSDISVFTDGEIPRVNVDTERISQVLVILVENALNYSPPGSPVEIRACASGDEGVAVAVMDRGWGIPREHRERVFERFYQVGDVKHHSAEGIGLGLYIAREIVEAHGGVIQHEPREGGGSIFRFTLP